MDTQVVGPGPLERVLYLVVWGGIVGSSVGILGSVVDSTDEIGPRVLAAAVLLPIGVFATWAILRAASAKLIVGDHEVRIRNVFKSRVIPRSELRRFAAVPGGKWIVAQTVDGEMIPVSAISSGLIWTAKKRAAKWNRRFGLEGG